MAGWPPMRGRNPFPGFPSGYLWEPRSILYNVGGSKNACLRDARAEPVKPVRAMGERLETPVPGRLTVPDSRG